jgi:uncharacterized protein (DUF58 family)
MLTLLTLPTHLTLLTLLTLLALLTLQTLPTLQILLSLLALLTLLVLLTRHILKVGVADIMRLPYRTGAFDACVCIAVLHHISSPARRLRVRNLF